jgi:hypothetical protein
VSPPDACARSEVGTNTGGATNVGASGGVVGDSIKVGPSGDVRDRSLAPHASPDGDASKPTGTGDF